MKILKLIILSLLVCSHCYGQNSGNQKYNAQKARQELAHIEALKDSIAKVKKAKQDSLRKDRLKKSIAAVTNKNNGQCSPELRKSEAGRELCKWQKESKVKADSTRKGNGPRIPNGGQGKGGDNKGKKPQPAKKEIPKGKTRCSACKGEGWYGQSKDKEEARRHPATFTDPCNYCNGKGYY